MYIRKPLYYDQHSYQYIGTPPMSTESNTPKTDSDENRDKKDKKNFLATRAIVYLLSGINKKFHFPVGYHFVNGMTSTSLTELTKDIIIKVSEQGVHISNLTFDGAGVNFSMCKQLGANLDAMSDDFRPHIINPYDNKSIIMLIADPSHMLKLMRNLLGNHKILYDNNDDEIQWSLFEELQEVSTTGNLLTHKLTKKHTKEWSNNKMNVRLASETYSRSVANSMKLLRIEGHPLFENSEPTERFTQILNTCFDILNSSNPRHSDAFKRALNDDNKQMVFEFIENVIPYFRSLKMLSSRSNDIDEMASTESKVHVLQTISKTPVLGFLMNLHNLPRMYDLYVAKGEEVSSIVPKPMKYFRTYAMSQDHLELFFAKIRINNGHNDNPNIIQFKGAYRKLLSNVEPESANCMVLESFESNLDTFQSLNSPNSNVFSVSSKPSSRARADIVSDPIFIRNLQEFNTSVNFDESEQISDMQAMAANQHLVDGYSNISIAYAAYIIEGRLDSRPIYCECCIDVFSENIKVSDPTIGIVSEKNPCASTYYICKIADKYFNTYKPSEKQKFDYRVLFYKIFEDIDYNKIYADSDFKDHEEHRFHLVKFIVKSYIQMKTKQISKEITYNEYQKIIRSKLTKWIHFSGQ